MVTLWMASLFVFAACHDDDDDDGGELLDDTDYDFPPFLRDKNF